MDRPMMAEQPGPNRSPERAEKRAGTENLLEVG